MLRAPSGRSGTTEPAGASRQLGLVSTASTALVASGAARTGGLEGTTAPCRSSEIRATSLREPTEGCGPTGTGTATPSLGAVAAPQERLSGCPMGSRPEPVAPVTAAARQVTVAAALGTAYCHGVGRRFRGCHVVSVVTYSCASVTLNPQPPCLSVRVTYWAQSECRRSLTLPCTIVFLQWCRGAADRF